MGNYRFKLSDMIPNAWFYKLKYTSTKPKEEHHHHKPTKKSSSKHSTTSSSSSSSLQSVPSHNHIITTKQQPHMSEQRKSYYFTRDLTNNNLNPYSPTKPAEIKKSFNAETPRKSSSRRRRSTKRNSRHNSPRLVTSSISAGCSCRATFESVWTKMDDPITTTPVHPTSSSSDCDSVLPEYGSGQDGSPSWSTSCNCSVRNDSSILDDDDDDAKESNTTDTSAEPIHQIPPIVTKKKTEPTKILRAPKELVEEKTRRRLSVKVVKEETTTTTWRSSSTTAKNNHHKNVITSTSPARGRLSSASSQSGVRLRTNSPRMRIQGRKSVSSTTTRRASVSESFAVVKASRDPKKDFRKSMVEMIVENDIRNSKDLEELLACYLSLNSDEYHDLIINVFKQIWFDFVHLRLK